MAFTEFEVKKYEKVVGAYVEQHRPPLHLRTQLDLSFRISGQSIEIFEIRPRWNSPKQMIEEAVAKVTYVKSQRIWKVYWQPADLKWHRYDPKPDVKTVEAFLELVDEDEYGCFFG